MDKRSRTQRIMEKALSLREENVPTMPTGFVDVIGSTRVFTDVEADKENLATVADTAIIPLTKQHPTGNSEMQPDDSSMEVCVHAPSTETVNPNELSECHTKGEKETVPNTLDIFGTEPQRERSVSSSSSESSTTSDSSTSSDGASPINSEDSIKDPNYVSTSSDSSSEDEMEINSTTKKRKVEDRSLSIKTSKKRKRNPQMWKKNIAKVLRNSGHSYTSTAVIKKENTKLKIKIVRPAKTLLPRCGGQCKLKCTEKVTNDQRTIIFNDYWNLKDIDKQREFILSNLKTITPRYKYTNAGRPRKPNSAYYFLIDQQQVRVCKRFFISTLAISHKVISTVLKKVSVCDSGRVLEKDRRGRHGNHYRIDDDIKNSVRDHINSIPRIESHYCRSHSTREFIDESRTIADLHRDYAGQRKQQKLLFANYVMYARKFYEEFNISFHLPKKDQCELCLQYKTSNDQQKKEMENKYRTHQAEKELSRREKKNDKDDNDPKTIAIVFDLQAVLPCPVGDANWFYYVSKLNAFNFTLYELKSRDSTCFLWHEGEAHRGANEIGKCIFRYLEQISQTDVDLNVFFYSDNCTGQNKNRFIVAMYMYALFSLNLESITHKFLITGHTQNEGDSMHALIEKQIKRYRRSNPIYAPDQYACIIRSSKKKGTSYKMNELCHRDIFDLKALAADLSVTSPRDLKLSEIEVFKLTKNNPGTLYYKTSYAQEEFREVCMINSRKK